MSEQHHILVVDDDERLRDLLSRFLKEHGFIVSTAEDAAAARHQLKSLCFDLIVLDIMMPGESGLELTNWLRAQEETIAKVPILLLSAKGELDDRITGLETGADDYLPKPFEPRELLARLRSIIRRAPAIEEKIKTSDDVKFGNFVFNPESLELLCDGVAMKLPPIELHLLSQLALANGEPVGREDLAASAPIPSSPRSIDVQIGRLRRKIEPDPKIPKHIHTIRGLGYRLMLGWTT
ncbi:MAG: response regulator [Alphaproteobacteria bacterium]